MELDELIFGKIVKYFKRKRKIEILENPNTIFLKDIKSRLIIVSRAFTGQPIDVFFAEKEGGFKNNNFFLPEYFNAFDSKEKNLDFYFFRTLFLCIQKRLEINLTNHPIFTDDLKNKILVQLFQEFPQLESVYNDLVSYYVEKNKNSNVDFSMIYGKFMLDEVEINDNNELNTNTQTNNKKGVDPKTTLKVRAVEEIQSLQVDKQQQEDYVMLHNFEKVETAEEFNGSWRDFDGSDDLKDHENALEELKMKFTVRVDEETHSVYQSDFIENTTVSESGSYDDKGFCLFYDEWDFSKNMYKENYCKLYPVSLNKVDSNYYKSTISKNTILLNDIKKTVVSINNRWKQVRKQTNGAEIDIDAATDLYIDLYNKKTPNEQIYFSNRKLEKDISIVILLDLSLSSDSYAAGNKIIDVEKQVSILFGELLNEFQVDFAIDGFYSKTRNHTSYITLKEFNESWNVSKIKIGAVEPKGYTRIGTALRHATARLNTRDSKNKWIVLISDGKPNDYDKYEGKYGIQDIKKALNEAKNNQVNSFAFAIEAQAKYYLPLMFGQNNFQILTSTPELLKGLVKLFTKIKQV